jgi:tRNA (guanine-N7-)-methyltransferase
MSRSLKYDIPGEDRRVTVAQALEKRWEALFAPSVKQPLPLVVEIGFGRGEFLLDLAAREPETAFVGIEYSFKRVLKMARRLARLELENVRIVEARGEEVVEETLRDASVACFWVNFPDPWPKKRHFKRRLLQPGFVRLLASKLVPGGHLKIATDHPGYAEWIAEILPAVEILENAYAPDPYRRSEAGRLPTAYELLWRAEGRDFHFFDYVRRGG